MLMTPWMHSDIMSSAVISAYESEPLGTHSVQRYHKPKWRLYLCCLSPIYSENYPILNDSTLLCFPVCPLTKTTQTQYIHTSAAPNICCTKHFFFCKCQDLCCNVISFPQLDHPKPTSRLHGNTLHSIISPTSKLYYLRSTRHNGALASVLGLTSDSHKPRLTGTACESR